MINTPTTLDVPLRMLDDGSIRVGETRVLLEIVIHTYWRGATPESIVESFSTLNLSDVYAVIAYYLQNQAEVDNYVRQADEAGEQMRLESEVRDPQRAGLRERLLARQAVKHADW